MKKIPVKIKYTLLSVLLTAAVAVGLLLLNLIAGRLDLTFDLTRRDLYSLTRETKDLLEDIEQEVVLYYLAKPGQEQIGVYELLRQYAAFERVELRQIDPDRNPALVARYAEPAGEGEDPKTISSGSVIVVSGDRSRVVPNIDLYNVSYESSGQMQVYGFKAEQSLTAAVQYAATGQRVTVYQVTGHNEYMFADFGYDEPLKKSNIELEKINLTTAERIPEEADIVAVLSPSWDYSRNETDKIRAFLERGGSLFIALDLTQEPIPNLGDLLSSWNIQVDRGIIMEQDSDRLLPEFGGIPLVFTPSYEEDVIAGSLIENSQNMVLVSSLGFSQTALTKRNIDLIPLLSSSQSSWLRLDLNTTVSSRIESDRRGPIYAAVAAAEKNIETGIREGAKVIAVGSGQSFAPLSGLGTLKANYDFTVSAFGWLAGDQKTINVQSRSLYQLPLQISAAYAFSYAALTVVIIPVLIVAAGLIIYLRRKRL
jgi:ABC-2 type transport system permease protein